MFFRQPENLLQNFQTKTPLELLQTVSKSHYFNSKYAILSL
ncbi:hypothetical protein HPSSW114_1665 [Glaesserella parasuis SW114]|nr:hypothetical protein HPSSW114_1665 [Glaesserella parasuis SW114]